MTVFLSALVAIVVYMTAWFLVSISIKRNDIADMDWGIVFIVVSWLSYLRADVQTTVGLVAAVLVSVWGIRLAWHIFQRISRKPEDYRYQQWREAWGDGSWYFFTRSYLQVFMLQGLFLLMISTPLLIINALPQSQFSILSLVGILVWLSGFVIESTADKQLSEFVKNKTAKNQVLDTGLWKYSRHPNYFGEVTQWWGVWILAIPSGLWWMSMLGPATITFLILKVSGIPMLEKHLAENPKYQEYQSKTSVFIPWFVKS